MGTTEKFFPGRLKFLSKILVVDPIFLLLLLRGSENSIFVLRTNVSRQKQQMVPSTALTSTAAEMSGEQSSHIRSSPSTFKKVGGRIRKSGFLPNFSKRLRIFWVRWSLLTSSGILPSKVENLEQIQNINSSVHHEWNVSELPPIWV